MNKLISPLFLALVSLAFLAHSAFALDSSWKDDQAHATQIAPGVHAVTLGDKQRVYAFGKDGMKYDLARFEQLLEEDGTLNRKEAADIQSMKNALQRALDRNEFAEYQVNAVDSGSICNRPYELTAEADRSGFWYVWGSATAGFQQLHGAIGPPAPPMPITVYTFARVTGQNGTTTQSDSKTYPYQGWIGWAEADPAYAATGPFGSCMTAEATALIYTQDCIYGDDYRSISDSWTMYCD